MRQAQALRLAHPTKARWARSAPQMNGPGPRIKFGQTKVLARFKPYLILYIFSFFNQRYLKKLTK